MFAFSEEAAWNPERRAVEVEFNVGQLSGILIVPDTVFQRLLGGKPAGEACVAAYHAHRTVFERAAEAKARAGGFEPNDDIRLDVADLPRRDAFRLA